MKAVVAAFNEEKALVGAFSVITNLHMELFEALPGREHEAGLARVAALAAELVRLQHVAGVAVALVPRAGHAPTQLRARAPRVARVQLRAVPPVPVQVVAGGAAAAQSGPIIDQY